MPGTPICYQGEEIGMTNVDYDNLNDFRDVEVYTEYDNFMSFGATHEVAMQALRDRSRDNARSPYQWDDTEFAGFSSVTPWMNVVRNKGTINLKKQLTEDSSIYQTYKDVFHLRKELGVADGEMTFIDIENQDSYMYINELKHLDLLVVGNFKAKEISVSLDIDLKGFEFFRGNYDKRNVKNTMVLKPFEVIVYKKNK
jgi:glycosidase